MLLKRSYQALERNCKGTSAYATKQNTIGRQKYKQPNSWYSFATNNDVKLGKKLL